MGLWIVKVETGETPVWDIDVVVLAMTERSAKVTATRHISKTFPDARSVSAKEVDVYKTTVVYVNATARKKEAADADRLGG